MNTDQTIITEPRHRRGNVARLPKVLRDKVNTMLDDGAPYAQIVAALQKSTNPRLPHPVNEDNIANWKKGGYQDYLHDQAWRERMTIHSDRFLELANDDDATNLTAGGLHAAVVQLCQLMDQLFNPKTGEVDPDKYLRATNTLSRLSRSIINMQQHRRAIAKEKAAEPGSKEARLKAREELLDKMDELFGIRPVKAIDRIFGPIDGADTSSSSSPLSSSEGESRREEAQSSPEAFPPLRFGVADTRPALGRSVTTSEKLCPSVSQPADDRTISSSSSSSSSSSNLCPDDHTTPSSTLSSSGGESQREESPQTSILQPPAQPPKPKRELPNNWPELSEEYLQKYLNWEVD